MAAVTRGSLGPTHAAGRRLAQASTAAACTSWGAGPGACRTGQPWLGPSRSGADLARVADTATVLYLRERLHEAH